jgi:hypothetical protein
MSTRKTWFFFYESLFRVYLRIACEALLHTKSLLVDGTYLQVRMAEDAWNSRDPKRVALAYTPDR